MPEPAGNKGLSWIKDVDGIEDLLDKDVRLIQEYCGIDVLITLWEHLPSMNIYLSTKALDRIKKRYIRKHFSGNNVKELCVLLNCSERFVYDTLEEKNIFPGQTGLFDTTP